MMSILTTGIFKRQTLKNTISGAESKLSQFTKLVPLGGYVCNAAGQLFTSLQVHSPIYWNGERHIVLKSLAEVTVKQHICNH